MNPSIFDFLNKAHRLKAQLESDLRFEFLNYLENLKVQDRTKTTTLKLGDTVKAAIRSLPSAPPTTSMSTLSDIGDKKP